MKEEIRGEAQLRLDSVQAGGEVDRMALGPEHFMGGRLASPRPRRGIDHMDRRPQVVDVESTLPVAPEKKLCRPLIV
ncbi:hypothetical protein [Sinorhizobium meliloti]|uniref:hypothetical protein n=1 Tax=Rhizobium meliloti TaxID=382 RepID=UPI003F16A728